MSVTAVPGFRAAGTSVGIKPTGKKDFAVIINDGPSMNAAVVYTSNKCKANPVKWSLSLIHISEPTRRDWLSRMPSSA